MSAAIAAVTSPPDDGDIEDLRRYCSAICDAVAEALGGESWSGHGNYYVSAADRCGLTLGVHPTPLRRRGVAD